MYEEWHIVDTGGGDMFGIAESLELAIEQGNRWIKAGELTSYRVRHMVEVVE